MFGLGWMIQHFVDDLALRSQFIDLALNDGQGETNLLVSMSARDLIIRTFLGLYPFRHAFFRTNLCVLRTHRESRFCNPHVVILLN
jgi:hypothetical protein